MPEDGRDVDMTVLLASQYLLTTVGPENTSTAAFAVATASATAAAMTDEHEQLTMTPASPAPTQVSPNKLNAACTLVPT